MPVVLFGAFDRHNFGDLLFAHVAAALLPRYELRFAGLVARDLRVWDGHRVEALTTLAQSTCREQPTTVLHAGGELLTCDAWSAAVMLLPPDQAAATVAALDERPAERLAWAHALLRTSSHVPYAASGTAFPQARMIYNAVGGVELDRCPTAMRAEVLEKLRTAHDVSVRDLTTHAILTAAGIPVRLVPDCAVMVAHLFDPVIRQRARRDDVARVIDAFPSGYLALQFSADFGDDATLAEIARQLDEVVLSSGCGIVLFRSGAAPWHDDLTVYRRMAALMRSRKGHIFTSLKLWDICALLAHSCGYCGSSLHGRIVAMAYALPRINLGQGAGGPYASKQSAFAATWEPAALQSTVDVSALAEGFGAALSAPRPLLQQVAADLVQRYRREFDVTLDRLQAG
jgi:hypothetical protein